MIRRCAYCNATSELTKEHLLPAFLLRLEPDYRFGINERAGKFTGTGGTIGDVCRACNNGPLSTLDAYAKGFYEANGLKGGLHPESFTVSYDFRLLSRWLLKMVYNNLRTLNQGESFRAYINFMRKGMPLPNPKYLHIYLEIVRPLQLSKTIKPGLNPLWRDKDHMPPLGVRCVQSGEIPGAYGVVLNAFYFHLFTFPFKARSEITRKVIDTLVPRQSNAFRLCPENQNPTLRLSKRDLLDTIDPRIAELQPGLAYEFNRRRQENHSDFV
jgi:hypothetical protein